MMNLVDVLVEVWDGVHRPMRPVVPGVLKDKEDGNLVGHFEHGGERNGSVETEVLAHWVEEPDLGKLDGKVGEENEEGALCLFPRCGNFMLQGFSFFSKEVNLLS